MKGSNYDLYFFEEWLKEKRMLSEGSIFVYTRSVERFLIKNPNVESLDDYNNFLIEVAIKKRCSHYYSALKAFIEFKITNTELKRDLIAGLVKPPQRNDIVRERKHLDEDHILQLINYLKEPKHKVIALIQELTGVRAGDIIRLKKGGIVPEEYNGSPVLRLNILGKGRKRNIVYIHDEVVQQIVMDYITTHVGFGDYYFINLGNMKKRKGCIDNEFKMIRMNWQWFWIDLKQALNMAGIDKADFATHDFRRCFARRVWEKWKDVFKLQKALGHADPKVTMRYLEQSGLQNIDLHYEIQKG